MLNDFILKPLIRERVFIREIRHCREFTTVGNLWWNRALVTRVLSPRVSSLLPGMSV